MLDYSSTKCDVIENQIIVCWFGEKMWSAKKAAVFWLCVHSQKTAEALKVKILWQWSSITDSDYVSCRADQHHVQVGTWETPILKWPSPEKKKPLMNMWRQRSSNELNVISFSAGYWRCRVIKMKALVHTHKHTRTHSHGQIHSVYL